VASSVGTIQLPTDQKTVSVMSVGKFLLQKMGWKEGEGLGKNNEGPKAPLELVMKMDRRGRQTVQLQAICTECCC
jgi:hypothetical protein